MLRPTGAVLLLFILSSSCATSGERTAEGDPLRLSPAEVHALLVGAPQPCEEDHQCASEMCRFGGCAGALATDLPWVREHLALLLRKRAGSSTAVETLIVDTIREALAVERHANGAQRLEVRAAALLSALSSDPARLLLISLFEESPSPRVQGAAAHALFRYGDERGFELVAKALQEGEAITRTQALMALGHGHSTASRELIETALDDHDRFVRTSAARALARRGDPNALPALANALAGAVASERLLLRYVETVLTTDF